MSREFMSKRGEITRLLRELGDTDRADQALTEIIPLVYDQLKALAYNNRYRWQGEARLGTTSLVHEAYAKLARNPGSGYNDRQHFFRVASKAMRSILIDNARWHQREKRGTGVVPVPLDESRLVSAERSDELLALDAALSRLEDEEPDLARVIECRTFGGLTVEETAEALAVSPATVKRRWSLARAWLFREMGPTTGKGAPA
jgi:RNA polymerase sigma factor (TIGR02999 family)